MFSSFLWETIVFKTKKQSRNVPRVSWRFVFVLQCKNCFLWSKNQPNRKLPWHEKHALHCNPVFDENDWFISETARDKHEKMKKWSIKRSSNWKWRMKQKNKKMEQRQQCANNESTTSKVNFQMCSPFLFPFSCTVPKRKQSPLTTQKWICLFFLQNFVLTMFTRFPQLTKYVARWLTPCFVRESR